MSTRVKVLLGVVVLVVVLAGVGVWWFLRDDAPAEVNLADAVAAVSTTTPEGTDGSTGTTAGAPVSIDGTWVVDTASGEFDFDVATGTFAGFRIEEELAGIGSTTAVGRTGDVTGVVEIADGVVVAATFEVDVTTITTNDGRRDDQVQRALDTGSFPTATFTTTEPLTLPDGAEAGQPVAVDAVGALTIAGVTQAVTFPLEAQLVGDTVVVVGAVDVTFSDFDVAVPDSQIVLSVDDEGVLELQVLLVQG